VSANAEGRVYVVGTARAKFDSEPVGSESISVLANEDGATITTYVGRPLDGIADNVDRILNRVSAPSIQFQGGDDGGDKGI
jgi:hypothetical protein